MKILVLIALVAFAVGTVDAGAAERFRAAASDYVVLHVPARAANDPIVVLEKRYEQAPDQATASDLAALYLERAREQREARYFGRAEMLLQPWISRQDVTVATLRVQADILQNRHEFAGALHLLDRAVEQDARDPGTRLMRASVKVVQGHSAEARADCAAVLASGASTAGTVCLAEVLGNTGQLAQAETILRSLLARDGALDSADGLTSWMTSGSASSRSQAHATSAGEATERTTSSSASLGSQAQANPAGEATERTTSSSASLGSQVQATSAGGLPASLRGWVLGLLADFVDRRGDSHASEAFLRDALKATPSNEGIRSALCDVLIARGALREALALLDLPAPSAGLLARRARVQRLMNDSRLSATRAQIDDLLSLASRRGERPHLREEALIALDVDGDAEHALQLAKANFETQRETVDVRVLVRAARARGDREGLARVTRWLRETGFEDQVLARIGT